MADVLTAVPPPLLESCVCNSKHLLSVLSLSPLVLCLLVAEYSPGPSNHLPWAIPSAFISGTWNFAHGDSCHLTTEEDNHASEPLWLEASSKFESSSCGLHLHSCPVLPRFNTALCSEVKLLKPNSWSCFITIKAQFVPWVCFRFFS